MGRMPNLQDFLDVVPTDPLELTGLVSGLLCVVLLVRENIWVWPIGLVYAVVSVFVFLDERLFASMLESIYYIVMNAYGWYFWLRGKGERSSDDELSVIRMPRRAWIPTMTVMLLGSILVGAVLDRYTTAALPFWDGGSMWMAFVAMWMSARKWLENWAIWLVVDLVKTAVYISQGIEPYAALYAVYIVMAVWGWRTWQKSMGAAKP